jgi:hypothetical protein
MTQAKLIQALQDGPKNTHEIMELTGMTNSTVGSTAKKLRYRGDLSVEYVKVGRYYLAKYTLADHLIQVKKTEEKRCLLNPFDIRNAKGIFTPAEYRVMNAQARRLYKGNPDFTKQITNNQFI